jgi:hypothetical protein
MGDRLNDGNLSVRTRDTEQGKIWGKTELTGRPRLLAMVIW